MFHFSIKCHVYLQIGQISQNYSLGSSTLIFKPLSDAALHPEMKQEEGTGNYPFGCIHHNNLLKKQLQTQK